MSVWTGPVDASLRPPSPRLPVYLRTLVEVHAEQMTTISSERLAEMAGVNAAKVRKDLSHLGSYGTRGVGYDVEYLLFQMSRELGLTKDWPVVIVGAGNLGAALANYGGFGDRGFPVAAIVDADGTKVGTELAGLEIFHVDQLPRLVAERGIAIGIIATPAAGAQDVADRLVDAGVTSILNFAPAVLTVPAEASLRKVDLALELQILSFYRQRDGAGEVALPVPPVSAADAVPTDAAPQFDGTHRFDETDADGQTRRAGSVDPAAATSRVGSTDS